MGDELQSPQAPPCILVIEDDPDIREFVRLQLEEAQYAVLSAGDGVQGLAAVQSKPIDLVILDLGLPGLDGLEVCRAISQRSPRPLVLILTARSTEIDRVRGLDLGADDYLVKPFGTLELVARVRALLRRPRQAVDPQGDQAGRTAEAGSLVVDRWERCAVLGNRRIELTTREFDLLLWFVRHPRRVFSRTELLDVVWGQGYDGFEHTVNSHLNRLRTKIEADPAHPTVLVTVRGGGYKLVPPGSSSGPAAAT